MTIEEKARAYDEAFERVKPLYEWAKKDDSPMWSTYEYLFPQLAESEDERTRREIIDFIQWAEDRGMTRHDYHQAKRPAVWIAYLEKQKEQKSFNVCEQCKGPDYNEQKPVKCIDFDNEFENQVSHLLASVLNGEHEYNEGFVKYAAQSLLGYAKSELKPDEWSKREKLFTKALQTANARIGQLFEENKKLKERKPAEIDEYKIIKKHITEDSLSSEVNKRLKECGWYVTDTESSEWNEEDEKDIAHIIRVLDDCYAYGKHDLSKTDHENLVGTLKSIHPQLKSEWNNEDEGELQNAIDALEFLGKKGTYKSESGYDAALKAASWLKSFRLQPKSEWSEKDEKMLSRCVKSIESSKQFASSSVYEKDKEINWLKALSLSLKKRNEDVAKLCSNEWSEEDEEKLKAICTYLRDYSRLAKLGDKLRFNEYCDFLKSLRPSWKPSEEQMTAFKGYIEDFQARAEAAVGGWNNFDTMIRLYEQLKHLRD